MTATDVDAEQPRPTSRRTPAPRHVSSVRPRLHPFPRRPDAVMLKPRQRRTSYRSRRSERTRRLPTGPWATTPRNAVSPAGIGHAISITNSPSGTPSSWSKTIRRLRATGSPDRSGRAAGSSGTGAVPGTAEAGLRRAFFAAFRAGFFAVFSGFLGAGAGLAALDDDVRDDDARGAA